MGVHCTRFPQVDMFYASHVSHAMLPRGHTMGTQTGFMLPMLSTQRVPLSHVDRGPRRKHMCFRVKHFIRCRGLEILRKFMVKNDRRNSGGALRQKETKTRQTES